MPSVSIDTFFACSLLVSVAIIATAFLAGTMQAQITGMQDLNKQDFLRSLSDHLVSAYGAPENWGSTSAAPTAFGLSKAGVSTLGELDADKISRLNSQNNYALPYLDALRAARLSNVAFGVSVSQMLQVQVSLTGSTTLNGNVTYTFQVSVTGDSGAVQARLKGYVLASGFETSVLGSTDSSGNGALSTEVPESAGGPGLIVVFARASFDDRVTAFAAYPFMHNSASPNPNLTYLGLSPLSYGLNVTAKDAGTSVSSAYAFSFSYQSTLAASPSGGYIVPQFVDASPTILVVQGTSQGGSAFSEWVAYPQVPLDFGADLSHSDTNVFVYPVTVNGCLYKLTMRFGDVFK